MSDTFGVVVSGVDIGTIEIDKSSEGYRQLMSVTKDIAAATAQAEAQAKIKDIHDKQRIEAENYEESLRIQREEGAYAQHMHTRTANFGAYQVEKQAEVGVAGGLATLNDKGQLSDDQIPSRIDCGSITDPVD